MISVAARVRKMADAQGISLAEVERRCGWGKGRLLMTLKTDNPTVKTLCVLARALGVSAGDLLE